MNHTTQEPKSLYLAVELEYRREYEAAHELRTMQARIADLEAQLYAIGAGGVGESIRPAAIDAIRLAEATFRAYGDHHAAKPDEEKAQRNYQLADTMRAALLAAVPDAPNPARQPLTEKQKDSITQELNIARCLEKPIVGNGELTERIVRAIEAAAPQQPVQQEPVAWMYEWNGRTHITTADQRPIEHAHPHFNKSKPLYTAPQPTENLNCKSTQKRLATLWGHVKQEQAHSITGGQ